MKICGWKTRAVFHRYNIVDHEDIADATRRLDEKRGKRRTPPVPAVSAPRAPRGDAGRVN